MRRQERLASVGSLAAGIAHEIRNPLASLSGSIQMLREELHLHTDSKHLMDIVLRETDRLNMIITEFLDYARPRPFGRERVDLDAILSETLALFRNGRECHDGIAVRTEMHPGVAVMGDAQRIRQVFWNLLINAAQAIDGRGTITVSAAPGEKGLAEEVIIVLADDGAGMPADDLKKIFDPFFTTKTNGTGLGLAIVYRIIEDHGGSISVTSRQGRGTSFTIRLPMALPLPPVSPVRISRSGETERTS
jgi:signal transduction histidine kinase